MIDLEEIRARDATIDADDPWLVPMPDMPISNSAVDRRALLAYVDALREAAGKVVCTQCDNGGLVREREQWVTCPDCADLRRLLGENP